MYINQIAISITDPVDANNSLANFDYLYMNVTTGGTPAVSGPFTVHAGAVSQDSYMVSNSANIRPYFNGSTVTFNLTGKAPQATTHVMHAASAQRSNLKNNYGCHFIHFLKKPPVNTGGLHRTR